MTDVSFTGEIFGPRAPRETAQDITLPKPQPFTAPVLISDCASPLAGQTILSLLFKKLSDQD